MELARFMASFNHIQVPKKGAKSGPSVVDVSTLLLLLSASKYESPVESVCQHWLIPLSETIVGNTIQQKVNKKYNVTASTVVRGLTYRGCKYRVWMRKMSALDA